MHPYLLWGIILAICTFSILRNDRKYKYNFLHFLKTIQCIKGWICQYQYFFIPVLAHNVLFTGPLPMSASHCSDPSMVCSPIEHWSGGTLPSVLGTFKYQISHLFCRSWSQSLEVRSKGLRSPIYCFEIWTPNLVLSQDLMTKRYQTLKWAIVLYVWRR